MNSSDESTTICAFRARGRSPLPLAFDDADSPVSGNPEGDVSVVEFFDYNCPYFKVMAPVMQQAQAADPRLRIVYKEFPVLGPGSVFARKQLSRPTSRVNTLCSITRFTRRAAKSTRQKCSKSLPRSASISIRLKADMKDSAINGDLDKNTKLGELLHITGTPGFVVGD